MREGRRHKQRKREVRNKERVRREREQMTQVTRTNGCDVRVTEGGRQREREILTKCHSLTEKKMDIQEKERTYQSDIEKVREWD